MKIVVICVLIVLSLVALFFVFDGGQPTYIRIISGTVVACLLAYPLLNFKKWLHNYRNKKRREKEATLLSATGGSSYGNAHRPGIIFIVFVLLLLTLSIILAKLKNPFFWSSMALFFVSCRGVYLLLLLPKRQEEEEESLDDDTGEFVSFWAVLFSPSMLSILIVSLFISILSFLGR